MALRAALRRVSGTDVVMWLIGLSLLGLIAVGSVATLSAGKYSAEHWKEFIVAGLAQGGVYALIALGYTMVYGILRMINFAHGEVFMSGAFTTAFVAQYLDRVGFLERHPVAGILLLMLVSMAVSTAVGLTVERVAYRPLRRAPRMVPLITAIGASFFLQYLFRGLYGPGVQVYPDVPLLEGRVELLGLSIFRKQAVVILAAGAMMLGLYWFVQRTRTGKAMRAVAEDQDVAALMGIDVDRVIVAAFGIGAMMAGAAGVLYGLMFRQVHFYMGFLPGIKAFTAAVLGGIGNIPGAMLGGLFLGIFEAVGPSLFLEGLGIPAAHQLKDVIAWSMLVLVLIFRPTGILGERLGQRA